jgi:hypothetical protein
MEEVRRLAHREKRQISQVVNELLTEGLARRKVRRRSSFALPSFRMGPARVNLGDRDALESVMES